MAVPDYQSLMLPLLRLLSDGKEHTTGELTDSLTITFKLTDADKSQLLPSGVQTTLASRVGWAITYLKKALVLESAGRATVRISPRGRAVISENPPLVNKAFLLRFPEFVEFVSPSRPRDSKLLGLAAKPGGKTKAESSQVSHETPAETMDAAYQTFRSALAQELQERISQCSPRFFEKLVVDLLVAMGYGGSRLDAGQAVGQSGDGGIDGIIKEDKLGLDVVYVQAKRWEANVGRPVVQTFAGSLDGQRARKGVLITTSHFSQDAKDYVSRIEKKIVLIDGDQLAEYMIDHGVGVAEVGRYVVHQIDSDYFASG